MEKFFLVVGFCCCCCCFVLVFFWWVFLVFFYNSLVKSMCSTGNTFLTPKKYSTKYISQHDLILLFEHSIDLLSHENLWHMHL